MFKINHNIVKGSLLLIVVMVMLMIPMTIAMAGNPQEGAVPNALPGFDFTKFFQAIPENALWVVSVVLGLVWVWGKLGAKGKIQLLSSLATGLIIGSLFMLAATGIPTDFKGWFSIAMYGIAMGLVASGIYEVGKEITIKSAAKVLGLPGEKGKG